MAGSFPFCKLPHCGTTILHLIVSACCFDSSSSVNRVKENSSGLPSLKTHQIHQSTTPKTLLWNVLEVVNGAIKTTFLSKSLKTSSSPSTTKSTMIRRRLLVYKRIVLMIWSSCTNHALSLECSTECASTLKTAATKS